MIRTIECIKMLEGYRNDDLLTDEEYDRLKSIFEERFHTPWNKLLEECIIPNMLSDNSSSEENIKYIKAIYYCSKCGVDIQQELGISKKHLNKCLLDKEKLTKKEVEDILGYMEG